MPDNFSESNMTLHPYRTIWHLSWPQVLMMVFHFLIGFVDVWVAGKINVEVQASLGVISQSLFFFLIVAVAVANGSVAAISQSMGAGLHDRVRRYVGLCLKIALVLGTVFTLAGIPLKDFLLKALQIPDPMFPVTRYFLEVYLYVLPTYYLLIISNAIFRARKQVMIPLYSMTLVTILNTFLDVGLGLGYWGMPNLGYKGLAWATFSAVTLGAIFNFLMLRCTGLLARKSFAPWRWTKRALPYLYKVAWPAGMMQAVWHAGYLVLYAITASLPDSVTALAGMSVGIRIESILFLPAFAFNFTSGIIVGHYLGAGQPDMAKKFGFRILGIALVLVILMAVGLWQVMEPIVIFLAPEAPVSAEALNYLFYNMIAIPFTLITFVISGAFNGAGATIYNLMIMGAVVWFLRLPLAYILGHVVMGEATGIWISMLASQFVQAGFALYVFKFKNWQRFSMIKRKRNGNASNV